MIIGAKKAAGLIGISIITCCAVLVCTMFLNFYIDVRMIEDEITSPEAMIFYQAQVSTAKVVCAVTGGCLLVTSVIMLAFYISHYIDDHGKELGILKALGYSNRTIAGGFRVFGISTLTGTVAGFIGAFALMPAFYELQNKEKMLPEIAIHFHPAVFLYFVVVPTVAFSLLSVGYAWYRLKRPVLSLLRGETPGSASTGTHRKDTDRGQSFLDDMKTYTRRSKKILTFFIVFASFCYSAMTQMSFSMKDLSSGMMGAMILVIGLVLAFTTLFLATTTVIKGRTKTIAMMRVFGYSDAECCRAVLGGYRPMSYIGFAIGTVYQYALLRIMVDVVFGDVAGVDAYQFDVPMMIVSLISFAAIYEAVMYAYTKRIRRISLREIMLE